MALSISNLLKSGFNSGLLGLNTGMQGITPRVNTYLPSSFINKNQSKPPNQPFYPTPTGAPIPLYPTPNGKPIPPKTPTVGTQANTTNTGATTQANTGQTNTGGVASGSYKAPTYSPMQQDTAYDFPKIVKGLLETPKKEGTRLTQRVEDSASESSRIAQQAKELSEKYGAEIARVGQLGAGAVAGNLSTGTNVVGSGNAAIASQSASQRMNALAQGFGTELQGVGEQLRGQEQQTAGLNLALQGGLTQQGQQLSGLQTAGQLAQPGVAGYGQTVFDPLTGSYAGGGGNLDPNNVASQLAQKVLSGQMTYEQATQSLGYAGSAGQQFLNNALQQASSGFNAPMSSAQIGGQAAVIGSLPEMKASEVAAQGLKDQIVTYLASNPKLNPTTLVRANFVSQWVNGELSDPKYQTLYNLLNEYTNTLTPILGVGGSQTNLKTQIAQEFINAQASGKSLAEVLENIQRMSQSKIHNLESGAMGGGTVGSPFMSGTGGGGYASGSYNDFSW